ncbi:DUF2808 domain-containing protein [Lyngbya confervoides]|uniref:DUF2808 domain-containing protein n=1 Tax=Lyngbya confervoides BDU141951 TaxID=1574623 RepID=A0ABD4T200_9CYAN|nr:DUF2808 domain-containing protein [Lyngbya confervoides]MCM1982619.1 DUF2808 domain-containing protein [Lyngbya confervoides BDU141951]
MKRLYSILAASLLGLGSVTPAIALGSAEISQIVSAVAVPKDHNAPFARYHIRIQVAGNPVSQLKMKTPSALQIGQVAAFAQGQTLPVQSTTLPSGETELTFAQAVPPGAELEVQLLNVRHATNLNRIWQFPIAVSASPGAADQSIGIARIHTFW